MAFNLNESDFQGFKIIFNTLLNMCFRFRLNTNYYFLSTVTASCLLLLLF